MRIEWRVYYDDGSTFTDLDGSPYDAPATGVQIIVSRSGEKTILSRGKTAYYWKDGWNPCDEPGMYDYLMLYKGPKAVLFGRTIRDEEYLKVCEVAAGDKLSG